MEIQTTGRDRASRRAELQEHIKLAAEILPPIWPLRREIAIRPSGAVETLDVQEAMCHGQPLASDGGYHLNEWYRAAYRRGRIHLDQVEAALSPMEPEPGASFCEQASSRLDVRRAHLIHGITGPAAEMVEALFAEQAESALMPMLATRLLEERHPSDDEAWVAHALVRAERDALGHRVTVAQWCDRVLGTTLWDDINSRMVAACTAWEGEERTGLGMPPYAVEWFAAMADRRGQSAALPEHADEAILDSLTALGLPASTWPDYLSLHLTGVLRWAGHIQWRPDPSLAGSVEPSLGDLAGYLAVRLWYERQLVADATAKALGIAGTYPALVEFMQRQPREYILRRDRVAGRLPFDLSRQVDRLRHRSLRLEEAWQSLADRWARDSAAPQGRRVAGAAACRLIALAKALSRDPRKLLATDVTDLNTVLEWLEAFPESRHGRVWQDAMTHPIGPRTEAHGYVRNCTTGWVAPGQRGLAHSRMATAVDHSVMEN